MQEELKVNMCYTCLEVLKGGGGTVALIELAVWGQQLFWKHRMELEQVSPLWRKMLSSRDSLSIIKLSSSNFATFYYYG